MKVTKGATEMVNCRSFDDEFESVAVFDFGVAAGNDRIKGESGIEQRKESGAKGGCVAQRRFFFRAAENELG